MLIMIEKQILTKKSRIAFYCEIYKKIGFDIQKIEKVDQNYLILALKDNENPYENEIRRQIEEKLRWIEVLGRKKSGYYVLYRNCLLHIMLFGMQAFIFKQMQLLNAHPTQMIIAAGILLSIILPIGCVLICIEIFRWNRTILQLKDELLHFEWNAQSKKDTYIVSVLFTRGHGLLNTMIYFLTGRQYTHASIGLGNDLHTFYSFNRQGFRIEHPSHRKIKNNCKESICYQFTTSKEEYMQISTTIQQYKNMKDSTKYNLVGVIFGTLHIHMPMKQEKMYFCSEFVVEQLKKIKDIKLRPSSNMYLPSNLAKALILQKNIYRILVNEI